MHQILYIPYILILLRHQGYVCLLVFIKYINLLQDIQFKLHSKYQLFNVNASTPNYNGIDLLAAASTFGLVIVGKPSSCEIQSVFYIFFHIFFIFFRIKGAIELF